MAHLGTLSFQANDNTDVFLVADVLSSQPDSTDVDPVDLGITDWGADAGYFKGFAPQKNSVTVDGDTSVLYCTYRASQNIDFELTIYVQYEEVEKLFDESTEIEENPVTIFL